MILYLRPKSDFEKKKNKDCWRCVTNTYKPPPMPQAVQKSIPGIEYSMEAVFFLVHIAGITNKQELGNGNVHLSDRRLELIMMPANLSDDQKKKV